jgi:hypothetical protein
MKLSSTKPLYSQQAASISRGIEISSTLGSTFSVVLGRPSGILGHY